MAQKGKKVSKIKVKKKTWFKIIAPKVFANKEIGETYLANADNAVGRKIKINLKDLTGNVKDQNVYVQFQVNKVNGSSLNTSLVGYELTSAYVKRVVRKRTSRIDDCFKLKTKGGKNVLLKSLIVTVHKAQRSTRTQLNKETQKLFSEEISKSGFDTFVANLVNHKIQSTLKKKLNKIFPVKELSVRVIKIKESGIIKEEIVLEDKTESAPKEKKEDKAEEKKEIKEE